MADQFRSVGKNTLGSLGFYGYLRRLQRCQESFELSDLDENIYFKQTEKWESAYASVKAILDKRDHLT